MPGAGPSEEEALLSLFSAFSGLTLTLQLNQERERERDKKRENTKIYRHAKGKEEKKKAMR